LHAFDSQAALLAKHAVSSFGASFFPLEWPPWARSYVTLGWKTDSSTGSWLRRDGFKLGLVLLEAWTKSVAARFFLSYR